MCALNLAGLGLAAQGALTGLHAGLCWPAAVRSWKAAGSFTALPPSSSVDLIRIWCPGRAPCAVDALLGFNRKPAGGAAEGGVCGGLEAETTCSSRCWGYEGPH